MRVEKGSASPGDVDALCCCAVLLLLLSQPMCLPAAMGVAEPNGKDAMGVPCTTILQRPAATSVDRCQMEGGEVVELVTHKRDSRSDHGW